MRAPRWPRIDFAIDFGRLDFSINHREPEQAASPIGFTTQIE